MNDTGSTRVQIGAGQGDVVHVHNQSSECRLLGLAHKVVKVPVLAQLRHDAEMFDVRAYANETDNVFVS